MSTWKIIQPHHKEHTQLLEGQAVIVANLDSFSIYAKTKMGLLDGSYRLFVKDNLESVAQSFHSTHDLAKEWGCELLTEDPVLQRAKSWAVASIMSSFEETEWLWDYLVAVCKDPTGPQHFRCSFANPCEAHERDDAYSIYEALVAERDSLMLFWESSKLSGDSTVVYMACEYDEYRSSSSRVIHGIFSTKEKAVNALSSLYGELSNDSDGGELGFVPVNNIHDVRLQVLKASIDEVSEI